jgi:putative DNA primase/helicase
VLNATAAYRAEMDTLGEFVESCCILQEGISTTAGELYRAYEGWAHQSGEQPISKTAFGKALMERGLEKGKGAKGIRYWSGVALKAEMGGGWHDEAGFQGNSPQYVGQAEFSLETRQNAPQDLNAPPAAGFDPDDYGEL